MKKILLAILMSLAVIHTCKAADTTITELRGMEDKNGSTHLFYRLDFTTGNNDNGQISNNIYHYDLANLVDTLFLYSGSWVDNNYLNCSIIHDYEFWHNDPAKYIYTGFWYLNIEGGSFIHRFDNGIYDGNSFHGGLGLNIELSKQNDSLLYTTVAGLYKSTDGGNNWIALDLPFYNLVSVSPYNDNEVYVIDNNGQLEKTNDGCKNFTVVDTSVSLPQYQCPEMSYDKDSIHIYYVSIINNSKKFGCYLLASSNNGEAGSWSKKYYSGDSIYISVDYSKSGNIYVANSGSIYVSSNYCDSLTLYKTLVSAIVGIYKKPGSDILYAATKRDIYEITSSSIKAIKQIVTSVTDNGKVIPAGYILNQNYPNPFNPSTTISYEIPKSGLVQLKVYDVLGREVAALVNEIQPAGKHSVMFNSKQTNKEISSGIYLYRLKFGNNILSSKMILLK